MVREKNDGHFQSQRGKKIQKTIFPLKAFWFLTSVINMAYIN